MLLILFIGIVTASTFNLELSDDVLFEQFVEIFKKEYSTAEEKTQRFEIFKENVKNIRERNNARKHHWEALYDINMMTDRTMDEMKMKISVSRREQMKERGLKEATNYGVNYHVNDDYLDPPPLPDNLNLPTNHFYCSDLVSKNTDRPKVDLCGETINQDECGCCYAAANANMGQILYANMSYYYNNMDSTKMKKPLFTPQRWMDNLENEQSKRCCGGFTPDVLFHEPTYSLNSDYPFVDAKSLDVCDRTGDKNPDVPVEMYLSYYHLFATNKAATHEEEVTLLKKILYHYGPFLSGIEASPVLRELSSYKEGIFEFPLSCTGEATDHEVVFVGYGNEDGQEYLLMRNSWGDDWGMNGFIKISTKSLCGIGFGMRGLYGANTIVFAGTCALDMNCETCNTVTKECEKCKSGFIAEWNV